MNTTREQRILQVLSDAQGDPARLALASVDLTYPDLSAAECTRLREALLAAAVPHWFDASFLAKLLDTSADEAVVLMNRLRTLSNVESFTARGADAFNVHEASRLPLREYLRTTQPELWKSYAERARAHLASGTEPHIRIEALYHLFAADATAAVAECDALDRALRKNPVTRAALSFSLTELANAGWLTGAALVEALIVPLWYRQSRGEISRLEKEANHLLDLARHNAQPSRIADANCFLGDVRISHGDTNSAFEFYYECYRIFRDLTNQRPDNTTWQRDLSVSLSRLGDVALAKGKLAGALQSFTESKTIIERLSSSDPANADWQRELSVCLHKLGKLAEVQGNLARALQILSESKTIIERLADDDPANTSWQHDYSASLGKLGDLAAAQGNLSGALQSFTESKNIIEFLAASDPANAEWQRELSVSLDKLGDVAVAQGNFAGAFQSFTESKKIIERLAAGDPANAEWQRDLSVSEGKLGELAVEQGNLVGALISFTERKNIRERLTAIDPTNAEWQHDLVVSYARLADICEKTDKPAQAKGWWRKAYDTLAKMEQKGMHLSPEDKKALKYLRARALKHSSTAYKPPRNIRRSK